MKALSAGEVIDLLKKVPAEAIVKIAISTSQERIDGWVEIEAIHAAINDIVGPIILPMHSTNGSRRKVEYYE